jgi:hypothetical protein
MPKSIGVAFIILLSVFLFSPLLADAETWIHPPSPYPDPTGPEKSEKQAKKSWSRYTVPDMSNVPAGTEVYIIQKGDTLWDIAAKKLGDPLFWPQIWEANKYITNPHWIYPGDPLIIPRPMVVTEIQPEQVKPPAVEYVPKPAPQPIAKLSDVYCSPYIDASNALEEPKKKVRRAKECSADECEKMGIEKTPETEVVGGAGAARLVRISGFYDSSRMVASPGDLVYVDGGADDGFSLGNEFFVLQRAEEIFHPVTKARLGRLILMIGRVKLVEIHEGTSIAEVVETCSPVEIGQILKPFEPIPIPLSTGFTATPQVNSLPSRKTFGTIVYAADDSDIAAEGDIVIIDLGSDDGVYPGDFFTIYRPAVEKGVERKVLGELVVLRTENHTATSKIVSVYEEVDPGDKVELK